MIYRYGSVLCLMQMLYVIKFLNYAFFIITLSHFPSNGIKANYHMIYMLNIMLIASVMIKHIVSYKSCD